MGNTFDVVSLYNGDGKLQFFLYVTLEVATATYKITVTVTSPILRRTSNYENDHWPFFTLLSYPWFSNQRQLSRESAKTGVNEKSYYRLTPTLWPTSSSSHCLPFVRRLKWRPLTLESSLLLLGAISTVILSAGIVRPVFGRN